MKKIYQSYLSENVQFLEVKFSVYLNRRDFVILYATSEETDPPAYMRIRTWPFSVRRMRSTVSSDF